MLSTGIVDPAKVAGAAGRRVDRRLMITTEAMVAET
jgi:hypothetical protein